ncbi:MAG TPA: glycosyltransferase, partial [Desulfocapsa sulfexigens]|nr:glycosyltransferase [Desulfocapsa sulfexigens]
LFVFPSIADTFGQTPMEAQACGVPVIVTNRGGPKDNVLDGETGLIVEGKSSSALLKGIKSILDKELLQQMGQNARANVAERSFENAFQELCKHYTL